MTVNSHKRAAHARRVRDALTQIFNDSFVMPNVDCDDLVVSIRDLVFGKTVREIYIDVFGHPRIAGANLHEEYIANAASAGQTTYVDLTDVMDFPSLMSIVELELQRRLDLRYTPRIRPISSLP